MTAPLGSLTVPEMVAAHKPAEPVKQKRINIPAHGRNPPVHPLAGTLLNDDINPLASRAAKTPQFFTMLAAASGGRIVTNPGGVLIRDSAGNLVGACGISGDTSDKDEMCAVAGIEAAGLKPEPGVD